MATGQWLVFACGVFVGLFMTSSASRVSDCATSRRSCMNFDLTSMNALNHQVGVELSASYAYLAMASWFSRDDIALRGFAKFFSDMAAEEAGHATQFMNYITDRGGNVNLEQIQNPTTFQWETALDAVRDAMTMEIMVYNMLMDLDWIAQQRQDPAMADWIESNFLREQIESIDRLAHFNSVLNRVEDDPLGEYLFDEELYKGLR